MSLGVLNNLSAMSAANNLNNTQNALSKTLQQLSSGSKINSGADDAAGLSLVNGLQANATALAQSQTNATEGVGLLTVADGALSQVTNLLNRAVTLATEVSNGTLNASQNTAANQEYQSILSEINNIGATTTYNQKQVFGSNTSIYVGDSSNQGASINQLNIRSLSSDNVGDTGGQMSYSNGTNNVFIDLSNGGVNAAVTDTLGLPSANTTITVGYLTKGANGAAVQANANITVGSGTNYANTVQGLISAINNSGLGLTASFGTAQQAGTASAATAISANDTNSALLTSGLDTGIIISGAGVGVNSQVSGNFTNGVGEIGTVTVEQASDKLSGTLNLTDSNGVAHTMALGIVNSTDTLGNLMSTINASGYGISAAINTTSTTTASGNHAAGTLMTLTSGSASAGVSGTSIADAAAAATTVTLGGAVGAGTTAGDTITSITALSANDTLTGALNLTAGTAGSSSILNLNGATLSSLFNSTNGTALAALTAAKINVSLNAAGTVATFTEAATQVAGAAMTQVTGSIVQDSAATTGTAALVQSAVPAIGATGVSTPFATLNVTNANDAFTGGTIMFTDAAGTQTQITLGNVGTTDNLTNLKNYINNTMHSGSATSLVSASLNTAGTVLTLSTTATNPTANPVVYASSPITTTLSLTGTPISGQDNSTLLGTLVLPTAGSSGDALSGTFKVGTETLTLGTSGKTDNLANLAQTINTGNYGITASLSSSGKQISLFSPDSKNTSMTFTNAATDTTASGAALTWNTYNQGETHSQYYSIGISGSITDSSTGSGGTGVMGMSFNRNGSGGVATISYSDAAGQSLSQTDLSNSADAQKSLTALNSAIAAVAAQDGYIGAQINTLNAVSSVMATQQQNVVAAQNAVQATDYATAASNMSKYQILSQTGISALAQANSMQQEVLKLLQ